MLCYFRKTMSLNNLSSAKASGQIATMLILFMVVILLLILTTVNLGNISVKTTIVSNAADTAALLLASRLASRSRQMFDSLIKDPDERKEYERDHNKVVKSCVKTGILPGIIGGLVVAVGLFVPGLHFLLPLIGTFGVTTTGGVIAATTLVGAGVGAGAGALAGKISGIGAGAGAMQGAMVGASVAGGYLAFGTGFGSSGTIFSVPGFAVAGSLSGAIIGTILGAASSLYNQYVRQAMVAERISKQIENIEDDYTRITEEVINAAMSLVVDDPNKEPDKYDLDSDGDTQELIPAFDNRHYERLIKLQVYPNINLIERFQENILKPVASQNSKDRQFLRWLHRREVECSVCDCQDAECNESPTVELFRTLKNYCKYQLNFWESGPDRMSLQEWYRCIEGCAPPEGFDSLDFAHKQIENFIDTASYYSKVDPKDLDRDHSWVYIFYTPESNAPPPPPDPDCQYTKDPYCNSDIPPIDNPKEGGVQARTDYYHIFEGIINGDVELNNGYGLNQWIAGINSIVNSAPKCQISYGRYTPNITDEDYKNPCGKPYSGRYLEFLSIDVEEFLEHYSPFYPCTWKKDIEKNKPKTGPYFNNPACHVTYGDKTNYISQAQTIEKIVSNLKEELIAKYKPLAAAECSANCADSSNCSCELIDFNLEITKLGLSNPGTQGSCYKGGPNRYNSILSYDFYYTYNCKKCCQETRTRINGYNKDGTPIYETYIVTVCTYLCNGERCEVEGTGSCDVPNAVPCKKELTLTRQLPGVTDIVYIPTVEGIDAVKNFLEMVSAIEGVIARIQVRYPYDRSRRPEFLTIDADIDDEAFPVWDHLEDAIRNLYNLQIGIKQFYEELKTKDKPSNGGEWDYHWDDTQGHHSVKVEVGSFKLPKYVTRESGSVKWLLKSTCTYIEPIDDIDGSRTWVRIMRIDPASTPTGQPWLHLKAGKRELGRWNPVMKAPDRPSDMNPAEPESFIERRTHAYYSWDRVGIARRGKGSW